MLKGKKSPVLLPTENELQLISQGVSQGGYDLCSLSYALSLVQRLSPFKSSNFHPLSFPITLVYLLKHLSIIKKKNVAIKLR
jgi:hypothetical protein